MESPVVRESTFTGARAWCPSPERWHSPDIDATEVEVSQLVGAMVTALRPDMVLETGTYRGHTSYQIGMALKAAGNGHLVTLEVDPELADESRVRCDGLPVTVVTMSSMDFIPVQPLDFVWFDSADSIRHLEFERFYPWMHDQTVVGFHDIGPQHQVRGLVEPLVERGLMDPPLWLHTPRGIAFASVRTNHKK